MYIPCTYVGKWVIFSAGDMAVLDGKKDELRDLLRSRYILLYNQPQSSICYLFPPDGVFLNYAKT